MSLRLIRATQSPSELRRRRKRVAAVDRTRLEAGIEPALALFGAAVGERVRHHTTLRLALQRVVADRSRGAECGLDVARIQPAFQATRGPDAGEAIGL